MFAGLYGDLPASKEAAPEEEEEPELPKKPGLKDGGLYGDLYGDSTAGEKEAEEAAGPAADDGAKSAAPKPDASTISAAPTVPDLKKVAEPEAKKKSWGVPKFMPQQRKKRPAPSPAGRNTAAALAAKKQKLLQQQQQSKNETEVRTPLQPAATGGLYTYEVQDEYDPRRPHDYDRLVALRKKQREIDAKMRELKEVEELEQRVAELEEELEETRTNLETASSIGQQMVERLQQIEEENEELRVGNMAPDAIHESEIVRPVHTRACPESVQLTLASLPFAGQPERHVARGPRRFRSRLRGACVCSSSDRVVGVAGIGY